MVNYRKNVPELLLDFDDGNLLLVRIGRLFICYDWRFWKYFIEALVFVQNVL